MMEIVFSIKPAKWIWKAIISNFKWKCTWIFLGKIAFWKIINLFKMVQLNTANSSICMAKQPSVEGNSKWKTEKRWWNDIVQTEGYQCLTTTVNSVVNLTGFYCIQTNALFLLKRQICVNHWPAHLDEGTNKLSFRNTLQAPKLLSKMLLCKTQSEHNLQAGWEWTSWEFYANAAFGKIHGSCEVLAQGMVEAQKNFS